MQIDITVTVIVASIVGATVPVIVGLVAAFVAAVVLVAVVLASLVLVVAVLIGAVLIVAVLIVAVLDVADATDCYTWQQRLRSVVMAEFLVAIVPVFIASVVECVEAWTVVVAVGLSRGWRAPLLGVVAALVVIVGLVVVFGATLVERIDEHVFEVVIGTLLVLFGVRWMRKALLRSLGVIPLNDENLRYERTIDELGVEHVRQRFDWAGFGIAAKTMLLEGLEITFLVITLGASGDTSYAVAITGAVLAFVVVGAAGWITRAPLARVPENTLKAFVSIMLVTFGTYWVAEGFGVDWVGGPWALIYLFAVWTAGYRLIGRWAGRDLAVDAPAEEVGAR